MEEERGVPKRDGSGLGRRANRGRGGCAKTQEIGKGSGGFGQGRGRGFGRGRGRGGRQGRW